MKKQVSNRNYSKYFSIYQNLQLVKMKISIFICSLIIIFEISHIKCRVMKKCTDGCLEKISQESHFLRNIISLVINIKSKFKVNNDSSLGLLIQSDFDIGHDWGKKANHIFTMEKLLAAIIIILTNAKRNSVIHFDDESAWSCSSFSCLSSCESVIAMHQNQKNVEFTPYSSCPGHIEAACNLANLFTLDCNFKHQVEKSDNVVLVAILKGKVFTNVEKRIRSKKHSQKVLCPQYTWDSRFLRQSFEGHEFFSPCQEYFLDRFAVGTYQATTEDMVEFTSKYGSNVYFEYNPNILDELLEIYNCLNGNCCSAELNPEKSDCIITRGPFGELIDLR